MPDPRLPSDGGPTPVRAAWALAELGDACATSPALAAVTAGAAIESAFRHPRATGARGSPDMLIRGP